jgi:hypothetical protein
MGGSLSRLAVAAAALALAGCVYDWSVPPDAAPEDSGAADHVSPLVDAGAVDVATPAVDAPVAQDTSVPETAPPSCATLLGEIMSDLPPALSCTPSGSACMTELTDECGCPVVVQAGTAAASYSAAVTSFKNEGCSTSGLCGSCNTPAKGQCLVVDATAEKYACMQ